MKPYDLPDARGHFGPYGGIFVAETLMHALEELRQAYERYKRRPRVRRRVPRRTRAFRRPAQPDLPRQALVVELGGAQIYFKREDLNHTGAHKINNTIGQALLARAWASRA